VVRSQGDSHIQVAGSHIQAADSHIRTVGTNIRAAARNRAVATQGQAARLQGQVARPRAPRLLRHPAHLGQLRPEKRPGKDLRRRPHKKCSAV
jgi:hypothetical protein